MRSDMRSRREGAAGVPYERQTLQNPNPVARFAHRRRYRTGLDMVRRHVGHNGAILDFGAGTGAFLAELARLRGDLRLLAFEPFMAIRYPGIEQIRRLTDLPDGSLEAVSAFEVCEHLASAQIDELVGHARRLLRPGGLLILSVPVMEGLALPVKEASRALLFRRPSDYRPAELLCGTLGLGVDRPSDILTSHKGFAHRALWERLDRDFREIEASCSPFAALPWWLNSQRFGVFAPRP